MKRIAILSLLTMPAVGCPQVSLESVDLNLKMTPPTVETGEERPFPDLRVGRFVGTDRTTPFLQGSELCATIERGEDWQTCWGLSLRGLTETRLVGDGTCWRLDGGDTAWDFAPLDCVIGLAADRQGDAIPIEVLPLESVEARFDPWGEQGALGADLSDSAGQPFAPFESDPLPRELFVAGGEIVRLEIGLYASVDGRRVAFDSEASTVIVETTEGDDAVVLELEDDEDVWAGRWLLVRVEAGTRASVSIEVQGVTLPVGELVGVSLDSVASLELTVAMNGPDEAPVGARALARDGSGIRVLGVPVRWRVEGPDLNLERKTSNVASRPLLMGLDYTYVEDSCSAPSERVGAREATLTASYGGVSVSQTLAWTNPADEEEGAWTRPSTCTVGGCSCLHGGATEGAPALLLLSLPLLAAPARRRRRAPDRSP